MEYQETLLTAKEVYKLTVESIDAQLEAEKQKIRRNISEAAARGSFHCSFSLNSISSSDNSIVDKLLKWLNDLGYEYKFNQSHPSEDDYSSWYVISWDKNS